LDQDLTGAAHTTWWPLRAVRGAIELTVNGKYFGADARFELGAGGMMGVVAASSSNKA